jgi:hypothetical protein
MVRRIADGGVVVPFATISDALPCVRIQSVSAGLRRR